MANPVDSAPNPQSLVTHESTPSLSPEEEVNRLEEEWLEKAKFVSPEQREAYKAVIRRMAASLRNQLTYMPSLKVFSERIRSQINELIEGFNTNAKALYNDNIQFERDKIEDRIQNQSLLAQVKEAALGIIPYSRKKTEETTPTTKIEKNLKKLAQGFTADVVKSYYGKRPPDLAKKGGKIYDLLVAEGENPIRDTLISNVANFIIADMAVTFAPTLPAYVTVFGAHLIAAMSDEFEIIAANLRTQTEWEDLRNYHYRLTGEGCSFASQIEQTRLILKALSIPSHEIIKIHNFVVDTLKSAVNALGITDESMLNTIRAIGKYSPESLEEEVWVRAFADIKRRQS